MSEAFAAAVCECLDCVALQAAERAELAFDYLCYLPHLLAGDGLWDVMFRN